METIAFLGMGQMGLGMASRLMNRGYRVYVWNRDPAKAAPLVASGAIWANTPAAAAEKSSAVFSMVSDDRASEAVWLGPQGALSHLSAGGFVIECSTLSFVQVKFLSAVAAERGLRYIDSPVTGWPDAAASGALTLLIGADPEDLETIRPVLMCLASTIYHFGPVGAGTAYKLMINLMGAVQIAALAEGVALAERLGLDKEAVITAIEHSAASSPQVVRHVRQMAERNFAMPASFSLSLRLKDAMYGLALAGAAKSPAPLGLAAAEWFAKAAEADSSKDEGSVIETVLHPDHI